MFSSLQQYFLCFHLIYAAVSLLVDAEESMFHLNKVSSHDDYIMFGDNRLKASHIQMKNVGSIKVHTDIGITHAHKTSRAVFRQRQKPHHDSRDESLNRLVGLCVFGVEPNVYIIYWMGWGWGCVCLRLSVFML